MYIVISGDIVSSTGLKQKDRELLEKSLSSLFEELNQNFNVFSRLIKGDYLECVVPNPGDGLRIALAIKSFVKAVPIDITDYNKGKHRVKWFKTHGIRLALGYGSLNRYDSKKGVVDGEAIYLSGRAISGSSTYNKERVVIKNTLFFESENEIYNTHMQPVIELLDVLLSKATARQSEVLYLKLLNHNEDAIAKKLGIGQSVVNQHSTSVGWNAIETAVNYFKNQLSN